MYDLMSVVKKRSISKKREEKNNENENISATSKKLTLQSAGEFLLEVIVLPHAVKSVVMFIFFW